MSWLAGDRVHSTGITTEDKGIANAMSKASLHGGEAIVEAFRSLGIEYVFSSPGSEWGPVWEAFARQKVEQLPGPSYLSCGHELLAVDMAIGYTTATGRMQATVLHAGSGLMQGSMAVYGARMLEIPMVVMSGEALSYGDEDGFDPGSQWYQYLSVVGGPQIFMAPVTKWATQATSAATLYEMVIRAGEMAQRPQKGPAYLNVPIETMIQPWIPPARRRKVPAAPKQRAFGPDIEKVADLLVNAKNPVITTESGGRESAGYEALIELAELLSIPVVESRVATVANFPRDNPLHQGYDIRPMLAEADLVLMVRNRVPWYPPKKGPEHATVVAIDEHPFKDHMVYQNLHADWYLEGDVPSSLTMLCEAVRALRPDAARVKERGAHWAKAHDRAEEDTRSAVARSRAAKGIHPANLCATLGEVLPGNTIYVDETTSHRGQIHQFVQNRGFLSYLRVPSGLGQSLGMALGVKIASPGRPVVALIGDGAFLYNPVVPALGFAKRANVPIMAVVFNNRGYRGMKNNHLSYYPDGVAARHNVFYGETLDSSDYDQLARASGALGIRIEEPAQLESALRQGYEAVSNGRMAIVDVRLEA